MRDLYLEWLPVFGGILGGTMLLIGILLGVYSSLKQVFGYSIDFPGDNSREDVGILPLSILRIVVFSVTGGVLWLHFFRDGKHILYGMIAGGIFGLLLTELLRRVKRLAKEVSKDEGIVGKLGGVRGIGPTLGGVTLVLFYLIVGAIIGGIAGCAIGLLLTLWLSFTPELYVSNLKIVVFGTITGGTIGGIGSGLLGIKAGVQVGGRSVARAIIWIVAVGIVGGVATVGFGEIYNTIPGTLIGIGAIGITSGIYIILLPIEWMLASAISSIITPPLILLKFKTIICNNCLRYTRPLKSKYRDGIRYCERCRKEVEFTNDPGEVLVSFGKIPLIPEGRIFMLSDPDFGQKRKFVEISEVYIDTGTCDRLLLEKFVTYIVNYPPEYGLHSVQILYRGKLDDLGDNLKNSLRNNFKHVEKIS